MSNYTFEDVKNALHAIVQERPDFIYDYPEGAEECTYTDKDGNPSCLIGQVIHRLDPNALARIHADEWDTVVDYPVDEWGDEDYGAGMVEFFRPVNIVGASDLEWTRQFETHEVRALDAAQAAQDAQRPWKEAGEAFDHRLDMGEEG